MPNISKPHSLILIYFLLYLVKTCVAMVTRRSLVHACVAVVTRRSLIHTFVAVVTRRSLVDTCVAMVTRRSLVHTLLLWLPFAHWFIHVCCHGYPSLIGSPSSRGCCRSRRDSGDTIRHARAGLSSSRVDTRTAREDTTHAHTTTRTNQECFFRDH